MTAKKLTRESAKPKEATKPRHLRSKLEAEDLRMNERRSKWAKIVVRDFEDLVGTSSEDAVADLLQYLMHLCDRDDEYGDFDEAMERAIRNYECFIAPQPNWNEH